MADTVSPQTRSRVMRSVRSKDTKPEIAVRKWLHAHGYRFRLHRKDLPGKPDMVLPKYRAVIFAHGCFWHRHSCKDGSRLPSSHQEYWVPKLEGNSERDKRNLDDLKKMGWRCLILWECEIKDRKVMEQRLESFLCAIKRCG